jgi:hypothetical protein
VPQAEQVRPDHAGPGLSTLIRALQARADWIPSDARSADAIVLLVIDGLGWNELRARRDITPTMSSLDGRAIPTVVPSTTPNALVSLTTGLPPAEHGVIGYRLNIGNGVLNVIRWTMAGGGSPPDPEDIQPRDAFGGQPIPVVTRAQFRETKFTAIQLGGAPFHGWFTTAGLVEHTRLLVEGGERFVFAYYDGLDLVGHMYGLRDRFFANEVAFCDRLVGDLLGVLPERCALVVAADHGHVHFEEHIDLSELGPLIAVQSGEPRFRYLHARDGAAEDLLAGATQLCSPHSWVFTRDQLVDEGWLGPRAPSARIRRRIGDVILAAREPVAFDDPANPGESRLLSGHGSITADEMLVPLLAGRGRA